MEINPFFGIMQLLYKPWNWYDETSLWEIMQLNSKHDTVNLREIWIIVANVIGQSKWDSTNGSAHLLQVMHAKFT